ncbi:MAG: hypothetical protein K8S16_21530 [Bacteroidales bacterium]|nr:hypothetical protein [Bacteroidales bacterium]
MKTLLLIFALMVITLVSFSNTNYIILIKFNVPVEENPSDGNYHSSDDLESSDEYKAQDRTAQFNPFHHQTFDCLLFRVLNSRGDLESPREYDNIKISSNFISLPVKIILLP